MSRVVRRRTIAAPVDEVWSLISDPYSLPRWWPRTTRVENVERKSAGRRSQWTKVLETNEGRGVRADFRCLSSAEPERYIWEQQLEGTPFARHLRSSGVEIGLRPAGTGPTVSLASKQVLRGLSRLGSPLMRRGQGAILDEALDGIERALTGGMSESGHPRWGDDDVERPRRDAKWWGWGDPSVSPRLDDEALAALGERVGELEPAPRRRVAGGLRASRGGGAATGTG